MKGERGMLLVKTSFTNFVYTYYKKWKFRRAAAALKATHVWSVFPNIVMCVAVWPFAVGTQIINFLPPFPVTRLAGYACYMILPTFAHCLLQSQWDSGVVSCFPLVWLRFPQRLWSSCIIVANWTCSLPRPADLCDRWHFQVVFQAKTFDHCPSGKALDCHVYPFVYYPPKRLCFGIDLTWMCLTW